MPTNTTYNPRQVSEFTKDNLQFCGKKIRVDCLENTESYEDLLLADDFLITGAKLIVVNADIDDIIKIQIVHPILGVVNEFIEDWALDPSNSNQIVLSLDYPAKLSAGLSIRCKYVASARVGVRKIAINLFLHKVLG